METLSSPPLKVFVSLLLVLQKPWLIRHVVAITLTGMKARLRVNEDVCSPEKCLAGGHSLPQAL